MISCYCGRNDVKNPFCPVLVKARRENKNIEFEHLNDCILPGVKTKIDISQDMFEGDGDRVNTLNQKMFDYFLPRFKVLLKYCKCEGKLCLGKAKG
jgi:hypothetical protein